MSVHDRMYYMMIWISRKDRIAFCCISSGCPPSLFNKGFLIGSRENDHKLLGDFLRRVPRIDPERVRDLGTRK